LTNRATNSLGSVFPGLGTGVSIEAPVQIPGRYVDHTTETVVHEPCTPGMDSNAQTSDGHRFPEVDTGLTDVSPSADSAVPHGLDSPLAPSPSTASPDIDSAAAPGSVTAPVVHPMATRLRHHKVQPRKLYDGIILYDPKKRAFAATVEPVSHVQALTSPA
jgi:hypothetical protein